EFTNQHASHGGLDLLAVDCLWFAVYVPDVCEYLGRTQYLHVVDSHTSYSGRLLVEGHIDDAAGLRAAEDPLRTRDLEAANSTVSGDPPAFHSCAWRGAPICCSLHLMDGAEQRPLLDLGKDQD